MILTVNVKLEFIIYCERENQLKTTEPGISMKRCTQLFYRFRKVLSFYSFLEEIIIINCKMLTLSLNVSVERTWNFNETVWNATTATCVYTRRWLNV